jgi:hypothetical protein
MKFDSSSGREDPMASDVTSTEQTAAETYTKR